MKFPFIPGRVKRAIKELIGRPVIHTQRIYDNHKQYIFNGAPKNGKLAGRVVVVSGGSGAIGRAICACMLAEGAIVYIGGRSSEKIETVAAELNRASGTDKAKPLRFFITEETSVRAAIDSVLKECNHLDVWVNCAGGSARTAAVNIHEQSMSVIQDVLDSNLLGCIIGSKCAAACMAKQKTGRIINIASAIALAGKPRFSDYAAAKAGIIGLTKSMALEVGQNGITMNIVSPGFIQRGEYSDTTLPYLQQSNCLNTVGTCEDVAHAVVFLASDEAKFITGQNILVDGGRSLGLRGDA